jgi:hypothetical protein
VIGTFSTKFQAVKPRMVKSYIWNGFSKSIKEIG